MSYGGENGPGESARPAAGAKWDGRPPSGRRPDRPFVPFVGFEDVVARCGHLEKFGLLPDGKDRFRQDRRKKAMGRDCKACRQRKQHEEQVAAERRRAEKEEKKARRAEQQQRGGE